MMLAIWERNLPLMRERLDQLDRIADEAEAGTLTPELRTEAAGTAHKLAGSLGMYGYAEGTEISRHLEKDLRGTDPIQVPAMREYMLSLRATLSLPSASLEVEAEDAAPAASPAAAEQTAAAPGPGADSEPEPAATSSTHSRASE